MSCLLNNIAWQDLWTAFALVFIFEGIMPFLNPGRWRQMMIQLAKQPDAVLRKFGFFVMLTGLVGLYWIRQHMGC